jgi:hypothetical protein
VVELLVAVVLVAELAVARVEVDSLLVDIPLVGALREKLVYRREMALTVMVE